MFLPGRRAKLFCQVGIVDRVLTDGRRCRLGMKRNAVGSVVLVESDLK